MLISVTRSTETTNWQKQMIPELGTIFAFHSFTQSCGFLEGYIMKLRVSTNETPGSFGVFVWIWLVTKYNNRGNNSMKMYTVEYETPVYCS